MPNINGTCCSFELMRHKLIVSTVPSSGSTMHKGLGHLEVAHPSAKPGRLDAPQLLSKTSESVHECWQDNSKEMPKSHESAKIQARATEGMCALYSPQ